MIGIVGPSGGNSGEVDVEIESVADSEVVHDTTVDTEFQVGVPVDQVRTDSGVVMSQQASATINPHGVESLGVVTGKEVDGAFHHIEVEALEVEVTVSVG